MGRRVERFEDLVAWQKARILVKEIYKDTSQGAFSRDFGLCDQVRRSAVSVMSNLAEGFERGGRAEFHRFLVVAKASCAELRSRLYVALDVGYLQSPRFEALSTQCDEVARIIGGLKSAANRQRNVQRKT